MGETALGTIRAFACQEAPADGFIPTITIFYSHSRRIFVAVPTTISVSTFALLELPTRSESSQKVS